MASKPDLSPLGNLWAWMDHKLHEEYACESIGELKMALEEIRQSIPARMLHKLFDSMDCRMKQVVDLNGDYVGI